MITKDDTIKCGDTIYVICTNYSDKGIDKTVEERVFGGFEGKKILFSKQDRQGFIGCHPKIAFLTEQEAIIANQLNNIDAI